MRRDPLPLVLVLILVVLGSVVWLMRDPDHPVLDVLTGLPVVGPAAERFREAYRPPPPRPVEEGAPAAEITVVRREPPPGAATSRPLGRVWVRAGTDLRRAPDAAGPVVATLSGLRRMQVRERRGDWRRVSQVGLEGSLLEGWVRQADLAEPSREELWQADPVLPLAAATPAEEVLAQARELMAEGARELPCGPFRLLTDVEGPVVSSCARLAGQLDGLYAERTGLQPVGEAAEAILLFRRFGAYALFRTRISPDSRRHAFAAPARGFVALAAQGRPTAQVRASLVHELVHLLNRRYLGPALPSWLDEGLAEELAMSHIAEDGTLDPDSLGRWQTQSGSLQMMGGGQVVMEALLVDMRRGDLPTLERLVRFGRSEFQADESYQAHYSLSALWVRYLLSGGPAEERRGFRAFLAAVAAGEPLDEGLLRGHLGAGWRDLESGFRLWLEAGAPVAARPS